MLSVFVFIDSLVVSASQDASSHATSRQNDLELHLGCHTCWLSCFTLVCPVVRTDGRAGVRSVYGHVIKLYWETGQKLCNYIQGLTPVPLAKKCHFWFVMFAWLINNFFYMSILLQGYLLTSYAYYASGDYDVNWTTPQCILTLRLISKL